MNMRASAATCVAGLWAVLLFGVAATADEGLVAYYTFDEGSGEIARDGSGEGHDAKLHGARFVKMKEGCALEFDGKDDYVDAGSDAALVGITGDLTLEAWARPAGTGRDTTLISTHYGLNDHTRPYDLLIFASNGDQPQFRTGNGVRQFNAAGTKRTKVGEWYHIVGVMRGNEMSIYVNGVRTGGATFSGRRLAGKRLTIGSSALGKSRNFTGLMDEVKVYRRALAEPEIIASYRAGVKRITGWDVGTAAPSRFMQRDTTPPRGNLLQPAPDSTAGRTATIRVALADAGSGIDPSSAKVLLDGKDVTRHAEVTAHAITLSPAAPLEKGIHRVEVTVSDKAGNPCNRLAWRFGVEVPVAVETEFKEGLFLVNGEPFFPIGIYSRDTRPWYRKPHFEQAAAAGVNCQLVPSATRAEWLDAMLKHGMKALKLVHYGDVIKPFIAGDPSHLDKVLETKDHPAALGWWCEYAKNDEKLVPTYTRVRRYLKEKDPRHPVIWIVSWVTAYKKFFVNSDAYFVYQYPIVNPTRKNPDGTYNNDIIYIQHSVLGPAFAAAEAEGKGKQVWFISQAFDYRTYSDKGEGPRPPDGDFRPNGPELRAMNYLALAKGAKCVLFYAPGPPIPDTRDVNTILLYPKPWKALLELASELRHLSPVLASGTAVRTVRLEPDSPKIHYREWRLGDTHTVIAVNAERESVPARWVFARPCRPIVLFEDRALSEKAGIMTDVFGPLDVHVYQWTLPAAEFDAIEGALPAPAPKRRAAGGPRTRIKNVATDCVFSARTTPTAPRIDGLLDDPCWQGGSSINDFVVYRTKGELAGVQTQAKIAYAQDAVYVAFRCEEPDMRGLIARCRIHDGTVWHDDCVELWLDTNRDGSSAYHFLVNPLGTTYDTREWDETVKDPESNDGNKKVHRGDRSWESGCEAAVSKGRNLWIVEMRIPAKALGTDRPAPGAVWGLNVARTRRSGSVCELSSWTGAFTTPISAFGTLRFDQEQP